MVHTNQMRIQGNWLFRWRSFLPLALVSLSLIGLRPRQFYYMGGDRLVGAGHPARGGLCPCVLHILRKDNCRRGSSKLN